MYLKYVEENKESIKKLTNELKPLFKDKSLIKGLEPLKEGQVVASSKKERLYKYGINLTKSGEKTLNYSVDILRDFLVSKYKIDKFQATEDAKDIISLYILKEIFTDLDIPFNSNYIKYKKKRELYGLLKLLSFGFLILLLVGFLIVYFIGKK